MSYPKRSVVVVALAFAIAACGGAGGPADGPAPGDVEGFPTAATVDSDDERVAHQLAPGRYRLQWSATDCRPSLLVTDAASGEVAYENEQPSVRIVFVPALDGGEYFIEQTNEECEEWTIELARY